jgi:hypothetical protein
MRLVVAVKDDLRIARKRGRKGFPEGLKAGGVGDNVAIVSAEVMRIDDGVHAFGVGDVVHDLRQVGEVGSVGGAGHACGNDSFHHYWDTENVHSLAGQSVDG